MHSDDVPTCSELMAAKSGKTMARQTEKVKWSKTDFRYWEQRIFLPSRLRDTSRDTWDASVFHVRIQHEGRRGSFSTGIAGRREAAKKAVEIFMFLKANGWDAAIAKYRHDLPDGKPRPITCGEYIELATSIAATSPRTLAEYVTAFRRVVADVRGFRASVARFDYVTGGRDAWIAKVDRVPMEDITPEKVRIWANKFVRAAKGDPLAEKRARTTANSTVRKARSLFGKRILPFVAKLTEAKEYALPERLPFDGFEFYKRSSSRYFSKIDAEALLRIAAEELPEQHSEAWKVVLLALGAGLRRGEIDALLWKQINFERGTIRIEETPYFKPKTDIDGEVELDAELVEVLRGYRAKASGPFVIESKHAPRPGASYGYARSEKTFVWLYDWLRDHGVDDAKPLHVLRKEFGSLICQKFGIFAASKALRHANIEITAAHYVDKRERVSVGLGAVLKPDKVIEIPNQSATSKLA
jgi:integrase